MSAMAADTTELPPLLGQSRPFLELMEQVSRVAPLDRPVLVIGERGTGKELIAARLHYLSPRWDRPLIKLNAAAIPETLLESELFGHEAGAFTGAVRRRAGRFELAHGGSLFLDEIASTSLAVQERLLRVVEYGGFDRVGGSQPVQVDVRLIGATNVDLPAAADAGRFRHDLLDRLAFDVLTAAPLRARGDDILLLAESFGRAMALELGWHGFPGFTASARAALMDHHWPGNVRELKNLVERAVYRAGTPQRPIAALQFDPFDSPFRPQAAPPQDGPPGQPAGNYRATVAAFERRLLEEALAACRHNRRATAQRLGLSYDQLRNELRKHGLPGGRPGEGGAARPPAPRPPRQAPYPKLTGDLI
jgi:psp operon transcriptional activator